MSFYQSIKPVVLDFFHLSKDAIHIHIGFWCLLIVLLASSKRLSSFYVLIPGLLFSALMEALDLRDDYHFMGYLRWDASLHDIINTNIIPLTLVLLAKTKKFQT